MATRGRPPKPTDDKFQRITVSLPPDLVTVVKEESQKSGEPISAIVATALEKEMRFRQSGEGSQ